MSSYLQQMGQNLQAERKARRLNQTEAGNKAGLSRREISEIENGSFRGSVLKVQDYALSLGFSLTLEIKRRPTFDELSGVFDED